LEKKIVSISKFLTHFPDLGIHSQLLTDISTKKWDSLLRECLEVNQVNKFMETQQQRIVNILLLYDNFLLPLIESNINDDNLIDVLKLLFADLNDVFKFYDEMIKRQWKNAVRVQEIQKKKGESIEGDDFVEILEDLLIKMNPYLPEERRSYYFESLKEPLRKARMKLKLEETAKADKYLKIINEFDEYIEILYKKLEDSTSENEILKKDIANVKDIIEKNILLSKIETEELFYSKTKGAKPPPVKHRFSAIDEMTSFFTNQINELTAQNEKLQKDLAFQKKKMENFLNYNKESKSSKI
jgi:hypothetical protein